MRFCSCSSGDHNASKPVQVRTHLTHSTHVRRKFSLTHEIYSTQSEPFQQANQKKDISSSFVIKFQGIF